MSNPNENVENSTKSETGKTETRLLTYNVFMRPPLIKNNVSDYKELRLDYLIKTVLPKFDIVCFEEMFEFGSSRRARLLEAALKQGFNYSLTLPYGGFRLAIDGGIVMLSKFPISDNKSYIYPSGVESDKFANKGALYAKIELPQKNFIHLFMTHTQASYVAAPPLTDESVIVRQEQLSLLRKFIDDCTKDVPSDEQIILVGDLNVNSRPQPDPSDPSDPSVVNGDTAEYSNMIKILTGEGIEASQKRLYESKRRSVRDMVKESYGHHPITFGDVIVSDDGTVKPRETVLTGKGDLLAQASLDYIFLIDADQPERSRRVTVERTHVEEFFVNDPSITQLSDHYGVGTYLVINS